MKTVFVDNWPENLLDAIEAKIHSDKRRWSYPIPIDIVASAAYVMELLPYHERMVILGRYRDGQTLAGVGETLNLTRERVRQLENSGLRKLCSPSLICWLRYGVSGMVSRERDQAIRDLIDEKDKKLMHATRLMEGAATTIQAVASAIKDVGSMGGLVDIATTNILEERKIQKAAAVPISDVALSARTFNSLSRAAICNLGDLANLTRSELKDIRNLGVKSVQEVVDVMARYDLHFRGEEPRSA